MPFCYVRERPGVREEILARIGAGETLKAVCAGAAMPCAESVIGWANRDQAFGAAYRQAQARGRHRRLWAYDEAKAKTLLARAAAGELLSDLVRDPTMPNHRVLTYWRRTQAEFAERIAMIVAARRAERGAWGRGRLVGFDARLADKILFRVGQGETLENVLRASEGFPSRPVVRRWRRENRAFDAALKVCMGVARARRGATRLWSPALQWKIFELVCEGRSLRQIGRRKDMPCAHTLYNWVRDKPGFADMVISACDERAEWFRDRQQVIAEEATEATVKRDIGRISRLKRQAGRLQHRPGRKQRLEWYGGARD